MLDVTPILPLPAPATDGDLGPLPPSQSLPPEEDWNENEDQNKAAKPNSVATHTLTIEIIHPPPDIRNIIDKTSQFVAKNGPDFERRIVQSNAGNVKFNFLRASDPYHAYYQHKLAEFRAQNKNSTQQPRTIGIMHPPPDIRNIIDKTSQFVAKNGPDFEQRIVQSNARNVKFNFLLASDPYHAYYQHKLIEFGDQNQNSTQPPSQPADSAAPDS
ncbi:hypothetical protein RND81_11G125300 [Saponaria officinalis]|uniref:SURP motif domain-containing protein n=1 Tax=Saponaria officinalis TaxID=3572 RepID=A0AAW1HL91_SAPOF